MTVTRHEVAAEEGKYLTFSLGEEDYGLEVSRVQEIVGMMPVTRIPRLPSFVAGVVNLRGRVIPVVDLRLAFGLGSIPVTEVTCIIVVQVVRQQSSTVMGLVVDEVSDVADLSEAQIEPTPEFGCGVDTSFIKGVGRIEERVVLLLDIDLVLSGKEIELMESAALRAEAREIGNEENA